MRRVAIVSQLLIFTRLSLGTKNLSHKVVNEGSGEEKGGSITHLFPFGNLIWDLERSATSD